MNQMISIHSQPRFSLYKERHFPIVASAGFPRGTARVSRSVLYQPFCHRESETDFPLSNAGENMRTISPCPGHSMDRA